MTKGLLRLRCIKEDKAQYIRWIDRYCAMNATDIQEEKMRIITKKFCETEWGVDGKIHMMMGLPKNGIRKNED